MSKRDFYDVLGVQKSADDKELKRAYRKQAMKFHPDRNPGDANAEAKFKEAGEAYDCLKDPQKRSAYDQYGHDAFENGGGGGGYGGQGGFGGFGGGAEFNDFADMFGDMFGGGTSGGRGRRTQRGDDLRYNMSITLEDAFKGKTVSVTIPRAKTCGSCSGSGAKAGTKPKTCHTCGGRGEVRVQQGFFAMNRTCPNCKGEGQIISDPCRTCHGSGKTQEEKTLSVTIPAGIDDGQRIRLSGEGEAGERGAPSGDLYIFVDVKPHSLFRREGPHVMMDIPVDFVDACLGGSVEVPTPDGKRAMLKVPEGTQGGTQFRMRGKGMPVVHSSNTGDMFVNVVVEIPTKLSKKQKSILKDFKESYTGHNNPSQDSFLKKASGFWGS